MQLSLIDPRLHPIATQAMLTDPFLRDAITAARGDAFRADLGWPHVEHLCDVAGRPAWAIDDAGLRYVVIGGLIFRERDFEILAPKIRMAARESYDRLDASQSAN